MNEFAKLVPLDQLPSHSFILEARVNLTRRYRARLLAPVAVVVSICIESPAQAVYSTPSGAKPDLQSKLLVNSSTRAISEFTDICRDPSAANGRYAQIADILAAQMSVAFQVNLNKVALTARDDNQDQIVIGDPSLSAVADLAASLDRNALELGSEDYDLFLGPNPASTNGSWVALILGTSSEGVFRGAQSLVDLLQSEGTAKNIRIRDYPDYPLRMMMHWLPMYPWPTDPAGWRANQKTSFQQVASWGANALTFGRSEFWKMDQTAIHASMAEVSYWSRYYGMEPVPEIGSPLPLPVPYSDPLWREGAFIRDEPFHIEPDSSVTAVVPPVDNAALNLDFETAEGGFARGWLQQGNSPTVWTYGTDALGDHVSFAGYGPKALGTTDDLDTVFQPGSFYVLEGHFDELVQGKANNGDPLMWLAVGGSLNGGSVKWFFHDYLRSSPFGGQQRFVEDYYFWTPPSEAQAATDPRYSGYDGPYFSEFSDIRIQFYIAATGGQVPVQIQIDEVFLERRNASLRNVMRTTLEPNLDFVITSNEANPSERTTYIEGTDYTVQYVPSPHYALPTRVYDTYGISTAEYLSSIKWRDSGDIGKTVLVRYTLGVPDDWNPGQVARTWCLKSPDLRAAVKDKLRRFYTAAQIDPHAAGAIPYAFNPKYVEVNVSEFRGANRCGRCVEAAEANGVYFANYLRSHVIGILDEIGQEFPAALATDVIALGSFSPGETFYPAPGEQEDYQFIWGGRYGDTAFRQTELAVFATTSRRVILPISNGNCQTPNTCNGTEYAARALNWPYGFSPPANVFVLAANNSDTGANPEHTASGEGIYNASTWLLPDCLGFYSVGPGYGSEAVVFHEEKEQKLMDYAWRRHSHPDATMQVEMVGEYVTDDAHAATVYHEGGNSIAFLPSGARELRDPAFANYAVTAATIDFGPGAPVNVLAQLNVGKKYYTYGKGTHVAVLTVTANKPGGGTQVHTAEITVVGPPPIEDPPDDPQGKVAPPVAFGFRSVGPNPFNPSARIEFGLPSSGTVLLEIYDLRGRRVASLIDGRAYEAGVHESTWDGRDHSGLPVASGTYFVRLRTAGQEATRKIVMLK